MLRIVTLNPSRLGCPSIPGTMKGVIVSLKGVKEAKVHYDAGTFEVTFDDTETSEEEIIKRVGQEMGVAVKPQSAESQTPNAGGESDDSKTCPM